jgi:hypothetical protein
MNRIIQIFLAILINFSCFSQKEMIIKLSPLRIFHPETPMVPISAEFKMNRFGIEYEHGFKISSFLLNWNVNKTNINYFRSKLSIRYYLKFDGVNQFVGLSTSYLPLSYSKKNNWFINQNQDRYKYQNGNINVKIFKIRAIYGLILPIKSHFNFEMLAGIGFKNKDVSYNYIINKILVNDVSNYKDEWIAPLDRFEKKEITPSLFLSFRIGYTF